MTQRSTLTNRKTMSETSLQNAYDRIENLELKLESANEKIKRLNDCLKTAWIIIADVGGDWTRQKPQWKDSVIRWRDNQFHPIMKELSERKSKEAKP